MVIAHRKAVLVMRHNAGTRSWLVQERGAKLNALSETVAASIKAGGSHTDDEVQEAISRRLGQLAL
jgi:hypothetical protein